MNSTMDNSTNTSMSTNMVWVPWVHFGRSDNLLFETLHPSSPGAVAGACIGLFLFCILERYLGAYRRSLELRWKTKVHSRVSKEDEDVVHRRLVAPFTPSHDIPRGVIQAVQSAFSYTLMLVVMSYNGAYILTVILGLGTGEVLFGRIGRVSGV